MLIWESAGLKLKEAALTADQIQQVFAAVEKGATDSGANRTLLGKGKDAAEAINKAWEDLKTKVQDSGPISAVDQKYDDVVAKIEQGLGGPDGAVSKAIMKYRKFAKEHPIAQGLIYSALIAAAGISGAGLGGAAVLGLLKMADKLLQGEKFSSAAYSGAKTGAMAYGSSKLGDYIKGKSAGDAATSAPSATDAASVPADDTVEKVKAAAKASGEVVNAAPGNLAAMDGLSPIQAKVAALIDAGKPLTKNQMDFLYKASQNAALKASMLGDMPDGTANAGMKQLMALDVLLKAAKTESVAYTSKKLSEGQVYLVFNRVVATNNQMVVEGRLVEGPLDAIKGAAGKAAGWLQTKGKNLTTKVTADKLNSAWQSAGSPTDSEQLAAFLGSQGVSPNFVSDVYKSMKIEIPSSNAAPKEQPTKAPSQYADVKAMIEKLDKKSRQRLAAYLQKQLGTA